MKTSSGTASSVPASPGRRAADQRAVRRPYFLYSAVLHAVIITPLLGWSGPAVHLHTGVPTEVGVMLLPRSAKQAGEIPQAAIPQARPPMRTAIPLPTLAAAANGNETEPRHRAPAFHGSSGNGPAHANAARRNRELAANADRPHAPAATSASANPHAPSASATAAPIVSHIAYRGAPPQPRYPRAALRRRQAGRVVIRVTVSATGTVADATVRQSSGHALLDDAALAALRDARFVAYSVDGRARSAMVDIPFDFLP